MNIQQLSSAKNGVYYTICCSNRFNSTLNLEVKFEASPINLSFIIGFESVLSNTGSQSM